MSFSVWYFGAENLGISRLGLRLTWLNNWVMEGLLASAISWMTLVFPSKVKLFLSYQIINFWDYAPLLCVLLWHFPGDTEEHFMLGLISWLKAFLQGEGLFSVRHTPITFRDQEKGEKMTLTLRGIGLRDIFHEKQRLNLPSFHCYFLLKNKESSTLLLRAMHWRN